MSSIDTSWIAACAGYLIKAGISLTTANALAYALWFDGDGATPEQAASYEVLEHRLVKRKHRERKNKH